MVSTIENLADFFTKKLARERFVTLRDKIMGDEVAQSHFVCTANVCEVEEIICHMVVENDYSNIIYDTSLIADSPSPFSQPLEYEDETLYLIGDGELICMMADIEEEVEKKVPSLSGPSNKLYMDDVKLPPSHVNLIEHGVKDTGSLANNTSTSVTQEEQDRLLTIIADFVSQSGPDALQTTVTAPSAKPVVDQLDARTKARKAGYVKQLLGESNRWIPESQDQSDALVRQYNTLCRKFGNMIAMVPWMSLEMLNWEGKYLLRMINAKILTSMLQGDKQVEVMHIKDWIAWGVQGYILCAVKQGSMGNEELEKAIPEQFKKVKINKELSGNIVGVIMIGPPLIAPEGGSAQEYNLFKARGPG